MYSHLKVNQLKTELTRRGASTRGRKADLVERLEAYDRNQNFSNVVEIVTPEGEDVWPDNLNFHQLTFSHRPHLPALSSEMLEQYFVDTPTVAGCIKAVDKGQKLVESGKVAACSVATSDSPEFALYFTGFVKAAMKKKVSYNFKLKINSQGLIETASCECPSGAGPTAGCKHIAAMTLVLKDLSEKGTLNIGTTCTDTLQQFSRPRKLHTDTPVKVESFANKKCKTLSLLEDPRPPKFHKIPGYSDFVRNTVINYVAETNDDIAIRYLYDRADMQAASTDHSYCKLSLVEYQVDRANMLTVEEAHQLEKMTRAQSRSSLWHEARKWRLTASNFGAITKCTSTRSRERLCARMANSQPLFNKAVLHGRKYESVAIKKFEMLKKVTVHPAGLFVLPQYCYLGASPDGIVDDFSIIEVKCPYTGRCDEIKETKKFPFLSVGDSGELTLKRTHKYYMQVQGQLFLTGRQLCHFVVYTFQSLVIIDIPIDRDFCTESLIPILELFYVKHYRKYLASVL